MTNKKQHRIIIDWNNYESVNKAELLKQNYEDKGYTLVSTTTNPIKNSSILIYEG